MQAELSIPSLRENENPILQKFDADLLLFDLSDNGRIIASRAPHARTRQGESFWDLVDPQERQSVKDYLLSYEAAPLVIRTSLGIAILFGDSVPHVSLAAALLPHMEQSTLLRVLERLPEPSLLWSERLPTPSFSARLVPTEDDLSQLASLLHAITSFPNSEDLSAWKLSRASYLTGVQVFTDKPLSLPEHWNARLCESILLIALLLCRRISLGREAFLTVEQGDEPMLSLRISHPVADVSSAEELTWLSALAARKRFFLDYDVSKRQIHLRFIPYTSDRAYLELKEPPNIGFLKNAPWSHDEKSQL